MNITDLIVEFIQQGNVVEFPGMGTLSSNNVSAHHDAATGTYHPARRTVTMAETLTGNKAIIRRIAEKECVTNEIAEQMWANYIAALKDKLQRNPNGHEFPGMGFMRIVGSKVRFEALEGLDLDAGKKHEQPLENIATYTPKTVADPFAAFDKPAATNPPVAEVKETAPVEEKKVETPVQEPVSVIPPAPIVPEPAKVEPVKVEPVKVEVQKPAAPQTDHLSEVKRMLDEIPSSPKDAKEARRAEKAAAKAEKEARKAAEEAERNKEKAAAKAAKEAAKEKEKAERAMLKTEAKVNKEVKKEKKKKEKEGKKKRGVLWIIILLLLLLLAAIYYFTQVYSPAAKGQSCAQKVELVNPEPFTEEDYPLLKFQEQDILYNVGHLHNYMEQYVHAFLASRHYTNAFAAVMAKVDEYANGRLHELMVEGYSPKRFFPHENKWLKSHYVEYKSAGARYYRYKVQGELMDADLMESILDDVVVSLGLRADGFGYGRGQGFDGGAGAAGKAAAAKTVNDKPYEEIVPEAPTFKDSKQGFDIVAGFFTSKKSANKCANQLKALGSDAYIISKSGGYYVSMGSAPTRTAAEALEKHIKSWYKSDVKIYNFNE